MTSDRHRSFLALSGARPLVRPDRGRTRRLRAQVYVEVAVRRLERRR